jgi:hypothetical protein
MNGRVALVRWYEPFAHDRRVRCADDADFGGVESDTSADVLSPVQRRLRGGRRRRPRRGGARRPRPSDLARLPLSQGTRPRGPPPSPRPSRLPGATPRRDAAAPRVEGDARRSRRRTRGCCRSGGAGWSSDLQGDRPLPRVCLRGAGPGAAEADRFARVVHESHGRLPSGHARRRTRRRAPLASTRAGCRCATDGVDRDEPDGVARSHVQHPAAQGTAAGVGEAGRPVGDRSAAHRERRHRQRASRSPSRQRTPAVRISRARTPPGRRRSPVPRASCLRCGRAHRGRRALLPLARGQGNRPLGRRHRGATREDPRERPSLDGDRDRTELRSIGQTSPSGWHGW